MKSMRFGFVSQFGDSKSSKTHSYSVCLFKAKFNFEFPIELIFMHHFPFIAAMGYVLNICTIIGNIYVCWRTESGTSDRRLESFPWNPFEFKTLIVLYGSYVLNRLFNVESSSTIFHIIVIVIDVNYLTVTVQFLVESNYLSVKVENGRYNRLNSN